MRKVGLVLVATTVVLSLTAPMAQAGVTCKLVRSWCSSADPLHDSDNKRTAVPEPASLLLLGIGVSAAGAAVARRRRKNK
jgi:PEP-CTERM motif